jgi:hypothetical protein
MGAFGAEVPQWTFIFGDPFLVILCDFVCNGEADLYKSGKTGRGRCG